MAHDVFISYAVEDKEVAEKVCGALEGEGIKCWMAPRDIPYGVDYEEAIVDAIGATSVLVLVLSAHSNRSPYVKREIQKACVEDSPTQIIPFRIEDVPYSKTLGFYLGSTQWLDALTPPLEPRFQRLAEHVRSRLGQPSAPDKAPQTRGAAAAVAPPPAPAPPVFVAEIKETGETEDGRQKKRLVWVAVAGGALLLLAVVAVAVAYRSKGVGNANRQAGGEIAYASPTPAGNPNAPTQTPNAATPTPQQSPTATPTASPAAPTPGASPRPSPSRNVNFRLPLNLRPGGTANSEPPEVSDGMIKAQIEKRMATHEELSSVKVEVVNGVVILNGLVPDADWSSTAQMMAKIRGVKDVRNNLRHN